MITLLKPLSQWHTILDYYWPMVCRADTVEAAEDQYWQGKPSPSPLFRLRDDSLMDSRVYHAPRSHQYKPRWLGSTTKLANRQSNVVVFHNLKNSDILRIFNSKLDYGEYGCSIFRAFISTYFHISKIFSILKYKIFSVQHSKVSHPSITLRLWREII